MMKKTFVMLALITLTSQISWAKCSLAAMFAGGEAKKEMAVLLTDTLNTVLRNEDTRNYATLVHSPHAASDNDYFYIMTGSWNGFRIAINNLWINNTFYSQEYLTSNFKSAQEAVDQLAEDFKKHALPQMKFCQKK